MVTEPNEFIQKLQELQDSTEVTYTTLPSDEPRFIIDANTRSITIPPEFTFLGVKNDHNAETVYFEIDRYFDNEDLSQHTCVVQFSNKNNSNDGGIYPVTTMDTTSVDGKIIFGWEIKSDATSLVGDIYFSVRFYSINSTDYVFTYNFNTLTAKSVILDTLDVDNQMIIENYPSELDAWTAKMDELSRGTEGKVEEVQQVSSEAIAEVNAVKESIPADYTTLSNNVSELKSDLSNYENWANIPQFIFDNNMLCPMIETVSGITSTEKYKGVSVLNGTYSGGANKVADGISFITIEANEIYTLMIQSKRDGVLFGVANSAGFITDVNGSRFETNKVNVPLHFTPTSSGTSVYLYIRNTVETTFNNDEFRFILLKGKYTLTDFTMFEKAVKSPLYGKKVAWYGDSIAQTNWWNKVNEYFGFEATNCGVGGTTITNSSNNASAMCEKTRMVGNYSAITDPNTGVTTQPIAIPADTEIIFICGGTNDWLNSMETGGAELRQLPITGDGAEFKLFRFYHACHYMFKNLTELFPNATIIVCGTPFGKFPNRASFTNAYGIVNNCGLSSIDYEDALCDIAGLWGIKCLHYGRNMQINDNNVSSLLDTTGTSYLHPTTKEAKEIFANTVINGLKQIYL